jgi:hypothetical protein
MPKFLVTDIELDSVARWLRQHRHLKHVRVRKRSDTLVLESGPSTDPFPHARLRRVAVHLWTLEMPHGARWQPTGFRDRKEPLLELLVHQFGWMLAPID